jgi:hypothetical protein
MSRSSLRNLPSVDWVLGQVDGIDLPRRSVVAVIRSVLETMREEGVIPERTQLLEQVQATLNSLSCQKIRPVINAPVF